MELRKLALDVSFRLWRGHDAYSCGRAIDDARRIEAYLREPLPDFVSSRCCDDDADVARADDARGVVRTMIAGIGMSHCREDFTPGPFAEWPLDVLAAEVDNVGEVE